MLRFLWLLVFGSYTFVDPRIPSLWSGVGSIAILSLRSYRQLPSRVGLRFPVFRRGGRPFPLASIAWAVGNNPDSISSVWRVDGASWNNKRLDFVTFAFQVSADLFEYHAFVPSNEATHVFSDDPCWFDVSYNRKHFRPLVAVV